MIADGFNLKILSGFAELHSGSRSDPSMYVRHTNAPYTTPMLNSQPMAHVQRLLTSQTLRRLLPPWRLLLRPPHLSSLCVRYIYIAHTSLMPVAQPMAHAQRLSVSQTPGLPLPPRRLRLRSPHLYGRIFKASITLKGTYKILVGS